MTFTLLGKTGDILSFLPLLHHLSKQGKKPRLVVSEPYASVLDGCSYVDKHVIACRPDELEKGMEEALRIDPRAICVQIAGPQAQVAKWTYKDGAIKRSTDSFQKEIWALAGHLPLWKEGLPLVFDNRSPERERLLVPSSWDRKGKRRKRILVHLDGKTSPFPYKSLLLRLLSLTFPTAEVVDLGALKSERIYDFLGLMERSDLMIACDSAFLHLSAAVPNLPVVALTKDTPSLWHGSAWRPQYIRYCRYSDFPARAVQIMDYIAGMGEPVELGTPKVVHVWSEYELSEPNPEAQASWMGMLDAPVEVGTSGRDSAITLKDKHRYPYLLDVLRLGCQRANQEDIICLTRPHTVLERGTLTSILKHPLSYAHRTVMLNGVRTHHPAVDMFCFPKKWWQEHQREMPDLIMGRDVHWAPVLHELLKKHGAVELPSAVRLEEKETGDEEKHQS